MKSSEIFQKILNSNLTEEEFVVIELLEESFTDVTPESRADYVSIDEFFDNIRDSFTDKKSVNSSDIRLFVKSVASSNSNPNLFFLDGLISLADCLSKYGGTDSLDSFENWFRKKAQAVF